jgi:APA family basic amino acid/polyamine antiporter
VGLFAAFVPGSLAGDLTSVGTLFAFVLVSAGVLIMRKTEPDLHRPFKTPLVPLIPILGILVCMVMIFSLDYFTLSTAAAWLLVGLVVYFGYSIRHSRLRANHLK